MTSHNINIHDARQHPAWCAPTACSDGGLLHRGVGQLFVPAGHPSAGIALTPVRCDEEVDGLQVVHPAAVELTTLGDEAPVLEADDLRALARLLDSLEL